MATRVTERDTFLGGAISAQAVSRVDCPNCGADAGLPCRLNRNRPTTELRGGYFHRGRFIACADSLVKEADGYTD